MFSISIFSTPLKIQFTPSLTFLQRDGKQKSTRYKTGSILGVARTGVEPVLPP